jgi:hypothetical protein
MHQVLLSHTIWLPIFNVLSRRGFEIGTKLAQGGFVEVWKNHSCGTEGDETDEWEKIYSVYPFLRFRKYGEADIKNFDQSLVSKVLLSAGVFLCMYYRFDKDTITRTVLGDAVFRLVFKYLYLVPLSSLMLVYGMMFSGKYETTHVNTVCQNIVYFMYIAAKLEKYKNDKYISILKMCFKLSMFSRSYSGDDLLFGWPVWLEEKFEVGINDFEKFARKCGLIFKYCYINPLYSVVVSTQTSKGYWLTELKVKGTTFLKNMMAHNYEIVDGKEKYVGLYPYRPHSDIMFRIWNSDRANSYVNSFFAKVLSIMYLSFGNREVFTYLQVLYMIACKKFSWDGELDVEAMEMVFKNSGFYFAARSHLQFYGSKVPTIDELRKQHDKHVTKMERTLITYSQFYGSQFGKGDLVIVDWDNAFEPEYFS